VAATLKGERNETVKPAPKQQPKPKVKKSKKG
jgi:hypothetical protein